MKKNRIIILGGATASGKSSLALEWAKEFDGEIVNADSMQIYRELDILTACPSEDDRKKNPHHLYRCLKGDDPCSAERWRDMARIVINDIWSRDKTAIIVGGTGLYLRTLVYGISKIPEIDEEIRKNVRQEVKEEGAKSVYQKLSDVDPDMAVRLSPGDSQRVARALEVFLSTGKSLLYWQAMKPVGGLTDEDVDLDPCILLRDRSVLYQRCDLRFKRMIEDGGAIDEVRDLVALKYDRNLPVMKSLGVPQLIDYIDGSRSLQDTIALSQTATRQFAKRQMTWFRNQFSDWRIIKL